MPKPHWFMFSLYGPTIRTGDRSKLMGSEVYTIWGFLYKIKITNLWIQIKLQNLVTKKETRDFRSLFPCELFTQFTISVHIIKLPACNSGWALRLELSSPPDHPWNAYGAGKWEELSEAQASSLCSKSGPGQHIHVNISLQPSLSRNSVSCTHGQPPWVDYKILQGKTTVSHCFQDSHTAHASAFSRKGSPYCWNIF